jgi:hypothetical protein
MIIYNVTIKVADAIAADWLRWMQEEHIADVTGTGCFTHAVVLQLMETDNSEGPTYAIQYYAESKALYNLYIERHAEEMRQRAFAKWGDQFIAFRTVMQIVK